MTLGLKRGTVRLCPHEAAWEAEAARVIGVLREILGDAAADIRHVGSTAIPAIRAKPVVDIAVGATDLDAVKQKRVALERAGFYYRPADDLPEQLLFAAGSLYDGTGDEQTHFIHVVRADGTQWRDYNNFRDYMNAFPDAAKAYEDVKTRLAEAYPVDPGRTRYLAGKRAFIVRALRKALVWSLLGEAVRIEIDRPVGHVRRGNGFTLTYPVNYGYLPGVTGGDGEALDVYLLGEASPVREADCRVIGVLHRRDDAEDKLIAAPAGATFSKEEMAAAVRFQEQWFDSDVIALAERGRFDACYERGENGADQSRFFGNP